MTAVVHVGPLSCPYCIDGYTPAGQHPILGPLFRLCPAANPCPSCHGRGVYPVDIRRITALADLLAGRGLVAALCPGCLGIADLIGVADIPDDVPEEDTS
jgi:hypothetical protein